MEWLNYHHLLYFWTVAREGGVARAAEVLHLARPTVSGQVRALEVSLGQRLFARRGRGLVLTDVGQVAYRYADEIFGLGRELQDVVRGRAPGRPVRFAVGVADALPKLVAHRLLEPVRRLPEAVRLVCREGAPARLLADLALHELDLVLSDAPVPAGAGVRAFHHALGESGLSFFAVPKLAARHRRGFPASLHGAPMLLPTEGAAVRRDLDGWFDALGVRPLVAGEFDDSALAKVFGQDGLGIFVAPTLIEAEIRRQFRVALVGRTDDVRERFFAISVERRLRHPAVLALTRAARATLGAPGR